MLNMSLKVFYISKLSDSWCCHQGHSDTVEDVVFQPGSSAELASVADDSNLLFWDTRSGIAPVLKMAEAHGQSDLHVVDWSSLRPELVATGMLGFPLSANLSVTGKRVAGYKLQAVTSMHHVLVSQNVSALKPACLMSHT